MPPKHRSPSEVVSGRFPQHHIYAAYKLSQKLGLEPRSKIDALRKCLAAFLHSTIPNLARQTELTSTQLVEYQQFAAGGLPTTINPSDIEAALTALETLKE